MKRYTIIVLSLLSVFFFSCKRTTLESYENYVVYVSMDAFRYDYPEIYDTPTFDEIGENGVKAERVISSFPTKTFPNHYSMATGLYPDHHGIISNKFYAPDLDLLYSLGNREMVENADFYDGEPIWNTAEKQGMKSASLFWVGSEAPIQGIQPSYWKKYDHHMPFTSRVDTVLHWLSLPLEKRPRLVLLYFSEPDGAGHTYGPNHELTGRMIDTLDIVLAKLRNDIAHLPYGDKVNLIVTSDHGMCSTSSERYVNVNDHVKSEWVKDIVGYNPMMLIDALEGYEDSVVNSLNRAEGVTAWRKEDIPEALHYGTHPRITNVVVVADSAWSIGTKTQMGGSYVGGAHGYDNRNLTMHNIFYAEGPAFKQGYDAGVFENVDIYPLICKILGLVPAEVDGKIEDVEGMLR